MSDIILSVPAYLVEASFLSFIAQQEDLISKISVDTPNVYIDFTKTKYISPLGFLLIASFVDKTSGYHGKCFARDARHDSIARRFLRVMGVISRDNEEDDDSKFWDAVRVEVQRCNNATEDLNAVNKLMSIIRKKNIPVQLLKTINWALFEVVDNAGVHGYKTYDSQLTNYALPVYFCAYSFPEKTEIAILDRGQGVHASFLGSGNAKYEGLTNRDALSMAIRKDTSGHPEGSPGFGLYGCSEIARRFGGEFRLFSGNHLLQIKNGVEIISEHCSIEGTMVSMELNNNVNINLEEFFGEGSVIASESIDDLIGDFDE